MDGEQLRLPRGPSSRRRHSPSPRGSSARRATSRSSPVVAGRRRRRSPWPPSERPWGTRNRSRNLLSITLPIPDAPAARLGEEQPARLVDSLDVHASFGAAPAKSGSPRRSRDRGRSRSPPRTSRERPSSRTWKTTGGSASACPKVPGPWHRLQRSFRSPSTPVATCSTKTSGKSCPRRFGAPRRLVGQLGEPAVRVLREGRAVYQAPIRAGARRLPRARRRDPGRIRRCLRHGLDRALRRQCRERRAGHRVGARRRHRGSCPGGIRGSAEQHARGHQRRRRPRRRNLGRGRGVRDYSLERQPDTAGNRQVRGFQRAAGFRGPQQRWRARHRPRSRRGAGRGYPAHHPRPRRLGLGAGDPRHRRPRRRERRHVPEPERNPHHRAACHQPDDDSGNRQAPHRRFLVQRLELLFFFG